MKNNEHCIYCEAGMPIFDDCEIGIVVYPNSVQHLTHLLESIKLLNLMLITALYVEEK